MDEKAAKKIAKARIALIVDYPFLGHLSLSLEPEERMIGTMATNGVKLYYDPDFVNNLATAEVMGVIAHEVWHCALLHIPRQKKREKTRWNLAADFACNELIVKEGSSSKTSIRLPRGCLIPGVTPGTDDFKGQHAEYIYDHIPVIQIPMGGMGTVDSHEEWSEWGQGEGEGGDKEDKDASKQQNGSEAKPDQTQGALEQTWRERVAQAATAARMAGRFPGHLEETVGDLLQPKLDWRLILRDMVTSCARNDYRLIPPHKKHLWRGIYLPSTRGEELNIAIAIDTSGSISSEELKEFLSEVKGICDSFSNYTIHLYTCDTQIHQKWELHPFDEFPEPKLAGRGGTSYKEPIEEASKLQMISALVYLTDLEPNDGYPTEPLYPVIWVSISEDQKPPWGKLIIMPRKQK